MSMQLETFDLFAEDIEVEKKREEEAAKFELGWEEVKTGLMKILTGHLLTMARRFA